jgi:hypothetical protein
MIAADVAQALREGNWNSCKHRCRMSAEATARECSTDAGRLILAVADTLCALPNPTTDKEVLFRIRQSMSAGSIISEIRHADAAARRNQSAAYKLGEIATELSQRSMPHTEAEFSQLDTDLQVFSINVKIISGEV